VKKVFLIFFLSVIPAMAFSQFNSSYNITEVYVEMDIGYETYYAEIDSSYSTEFGKVKALYKKSSLSAIGRGQYIIQLEHVSGSLFRIIGTGYILELMFANSFMFSRYDDYILDTSGFRGTVTKKER
jgi:hypothetical protein